MNARHPFIGIKEGDTFNSLSDLKTTINLVQDESNVQLYIRDSRTLNGSKKIPKVVSFTPSHLKYYTLVYSCKLGGKYFKSSGSGLRNSKLVSLFPGLVTIIVKSICHVLKIVA